jgi:hypothetical protein
MPPKKQGQGNRGGGGGQAATASSTAPASGPGSGLSAGSANVPTGLPVPSTNGSAMVQSGDKEKKSARQQRKHAFKPSEEDISLPETEFLDERDMFDTKRAAIQRAADDAPLEKRLQVHCIKSQFERGKTSDVALTNHFEVTLPTQLLYEYQIKGFITQEEEDDNNKPTRDRRRTFKEKAVTECAILQEQLDSFVADDFGLVVAWKDLYMHKGTAAAVPGQSLDTFKICLREQKDGDDAGDYRSLELVYSGTIPIQPFLDVCKGDIGRFPIRSVEEDVAKTLTVENAMNLILAESTKTSDINTFRMGSKKMYLANVVDDTKFKDIVTGVNLHEGYYSTVKLGMGKPLLNISTTASVFWREIPLKEYLTVRKCEDEIPCHIQNALKGVKIKVAYLGDRTKTIKSFGRRQPVEQSFKKAISWEKKSGSDKRVATK